MSDAAEKLNRIWRGFPPVVWVDVMSPSGFVVRMSLRQYCDGGYSQKWFPWVICGDPIDGWWTG